MGTRGRPRPRTADEVLAHRESLQLVRAVAEGRIVRGAGGDASASAPYVIDGAPVSLLLRRLHRDGLVRLPMSGPPQLERVSYSSEKARETIDG